MTALRLVLASIVVVGCSGEEPAVVDAAATDARPADAAVDGADVDDAAPDAAVDAAPADAAVDSAPLDAAVDAALDADVDAAIDAPIDAMIMCPAGTAWIGTACEDFDECALDPCSPRATCTNTDGSFVCTCRSGYTGNGTVCDDIDECSATPCGAGQICTNVPGGHTCTDAVSDECAAGTDDCSPNATCTDTAQGFTCICSGGTTGDGRTCQRAYSWFDVGDAHGCARQGTTLRCWGDNTYNQLGAAITPGAAAPQPAIGTWRQADLFSSSTCGVRGDGTWQCRGLMTAYLQVTQLGSDTDWMQAAAGDYHTCAIKIDRTLWCAGYNEYGELGDGTSAAMVIQAPVAVAGNDWRAVDVGTNHTCAIDGAARLWCWGWNLYGQLGVGDNVDRHVPTRVGTDTWLEVETGRTFTCGRRSDGAVLCWGDNFQGQLGNGEVTDPLLYGEYSPVPIAASGTFVDIAVGSSHSCALATDGAIWCWGDARYGAFHDEAFTRHLSPVMLAAGSGWTAVEVGGYVTCAQKPDDTLHCWGVDWAGQLGGGQGGRRWTPTAVAPGVAWRTLDARGGHACGVRDTGALWCWGANGFGELGDATRVPRDAPLRVGTEGDWIGVATALGHTCGLRAPDRLFCWGEGYGDQAVQVPGTWMAVSASRNRDCALAPDRRLSCWSPAATPAPVLLLDAVESMQAGHIHAAAIRADGVAWSWGQNYSGQLADGTYDARTTPAPVSGNRRYRAIGTEHSSMLSIENGVLFGAGHRYSSPVFVDAGAGDQWVSLSSGNYHSCGLRADGRITCLGETPDDGGGEFAGPWSRVSAGMGDFSCALDTGGAAYCWGRSSSGAVGDDNAWRGTITPVVD